MGKPIGKVYWTLQKSFYRLSSKCLISKSWAKNIFFVHLVSQKLPRSAPIVSYGEQSLEPEYWFIVSKEKCVHVYKFFKDNCEDKYGHIDLVRLKFLLRKIVEPEEPQNSNIILIHQILKTRKKLKKMVTSFCETTRQSLRKRLGALATVKVCQKLLKRRLQWQGLIWSI